jgi:hypothetical protein
MGYVFAKRRLGRVVSTKNGYSFKRLLNAVYVPEGWPESAIFKLSELGLDSGEYRIRVVACAEGLTNSDTSNETLYKQS